MEEYADDVEQEKIYKVKLYTYPDYKVPIGIFDEDELQNVESMMVLCVRAHPDDDYRLEHTSYVWRGPNFEISKFTDNAFTE